MEAIDVPHARHSVEIAGNRRVDRGLLTTLALDFEVRAMPRNGAAPNAVLLLATVPTYADALVELRSRTDVPVLLLLEEADVVDRVRALEAGADDVVPAPCDPCETVARLRALFRRSGRKSAESFRVADLEIDLARHTVRRGPRIVELSPTELALLATLARHEGTVVRHDELCRAVWGAWRSKNTLHTFVSYLRAKLNRPGEPALVQTVRGVGYTLRAETKRDAA
jgi:DNA-binding response OmpR family regulator